MIDRQEKILNFIARFHGSEDTFLHGCCYWFARILLDRFAAEDGYDVSIMYEPVEGHFLAKIGYRYYDIRGDVTMKYRGKPMYDMWDMQRENNRQYRHLMRDCRDFEEVEDDG